MPKVLCRQKVLYKYAGVSAFIIESSKINDDKVNKKSWILFYFSHKKKHAMLVGVMV